MQPCTCSATQRWARAWNLREAYAQARTLDERRRTTLAYTQHLRNAEQLQLDATAIPQWRQEDEYDPRKTEASDAEGDCTPMLTL